MKNKIKFGIFLFALTTFFSAPLRAEENDGALETYNRAMFNFNSTVDYYIVKPLAKGYRAITNEFVRERVHNFFNNLKEPASTINHSLQGEFAESAKSLGRFTVNTTLGLLGTFDVASGWGINKNRTGFDETLAAWCVPDGPFVMLPFFGPSTPRATVGMAGDAAANPLYWGDYYTNFNHDWEEYSFYYGISALGFVSLREENIEFLDKLTANSVDPYTTIKSAYIQNRMKMKICGKPAEEESASYDFDFDDEEFVE
ncbi:MAG: VacJ family lipoprotein [Alphaproteobacteria bacterium]|nr:VacJ family lipoprotein [Alphaproteobacteria bacterium]MBR3501578.1 VacJ family lipoprotein [Alphaproteobacteria bacterium]